MSNKPEAKIDWEPYTEEIISFYVTANHTAEETISRLEEKYGLKVRCVHVFIVMFLIKPILVNNNSKRSSRWVTRNFGSKSGRRSFQESRRGPSKVKIQIYISTAGCSIPKG